MDIQAFNALWNIMLYVFRNQQFWVSIFGMILLFGSILYMFKLLAVLMGGRKRR